MSLKVGAHVSISSSRASNDPETPPYGNIANAVFRQKQFGGNCGQIFTHSPQVWQDPNIGDEEAERFREGTERDLEGPWVIHTSYLVNLCTPKEGLREKSLDSMQKEVDAADTLGIPYVNVHLGAHTGAGVEGGLDNAASVIDDIDVPDGVTILIESDAGAGTKLGGEFEHLAGSSIAQRPTSTSASTPPTRSRRATIFRHPKPSTKRSRSSTTWSGWNTSSTSTSTTRSTPAAPTKTSMPTSARDSSAKTGWSDSSTTRT